jgi:hypothetical protein
MYPINIIFFCLVAVSSLHAFDNDKLAMPPFQAGHIFDCSQCPKEQVDACNKSLKHLRDDAQRQLNVLSSPNIVGEMVRQDIQGKKQKNLRLFYENALALENSKQATFDYEVNKDNITITINIPSEFCYNPPGVYQDFIEPWNARIPDLRNGNNMSSVFLDKNGLRAIRKITVDPHYFVDSAGNLQRKISTDLTIHGGTVPLTPIQQEAVRLRDTKDQAAAIKYMNEHADEFPERKRNHLIGIATTLGIVAAAGLIFYVLGSENQ